MAPVASTASNVCYFRVNFKSVYATPITQSKFTEYDVIRSYWGELYRKSTYFIIVLSLVCRTDRSTAPGSGRVVVRSWEGRKNEGCWLTGTGFPAGVENIMGSDNGQDRVMSEYTSSTC